MNRKPPTLSHKEKLSCRSLKSIKDATDDAVTALQRAAAPRFRGLDLSLEAYINCAVLYVNALDRAEQLAILAEWVPRLEGMLGEEDEAGKSAGAPVKPGPLPKFLGPVSQGPKAKGRKSG